MLKILTVPRSQVKAQVWMKAVTSNLCPEFYQRFSPDHCILLYQKKGNVCEIYDKHQVFQTLDCIRYWRGTTTHFYLQSESEPVFSCHVKIMFC